MSDFAVTWNLVRGRFLESLDGLSAAQLNWRMHPQSLTAGEMAMHVAGVEVWFTSQLRGEVLSGETARLASASRDGVLNDNPFPYAVEEITPDRIRKALSDAADAVRPMIENPDLWREKTITSALGPQIDGTGCFARLAYHPSYHQAQVHLVKTAPGFPDA